MSSDGRQIAELRDGEARVLPFDPAEEPALGRLKIWATADDINGTVVKFRSRGRTASVVVGAVGYVSRLVGAAGNGITIRHLAQEAGEALSVAFSRFTNTLTVLLATTPGAIKAASDDAGGQIHYEARAAGADGNDLSVAYGDLTGSPVADVDVSLDGDQVVVALSETGDVAATLSTTNGANRDVKLTAVDAGADGNSVKARFLVDDAITHGNIEIRHYSDGPVWNLQVRCKTGQTATQLVTYAGTNPVLWDGDGTQDEGIHLHDVVTVALAGGSSGAGALLDFGDDNTHLAGGTASAVTATVQDVLDAIAGNDDADALVAATALVAGGTTISTHDSTVTLADGADADSATSTSSDVAAAVNADRVASQFLVALAEEGDAAVGEDVTVGGDDAELFEGTLSSD